MLTDWISSLAGATGKKGIALVRVPQSDWTAIEQSTEGHSSFSFALPHQEFEQVTEGAVCLFWPQETRTPLYIGFVNSRSAVTTIQTRVRIIAGHAIDPVTPEELIQLLDDTRAASRFQNALSETGTISVLSEKLSSDIVFALAKQPGNDRALRVLSGLVGPKRFHNAAALQADAIDTALKIFGIPYSQTPTRLIVPKNSDSSLGPRLLEDGVVEFDAKQIPGMALVAADITGFAEFEGGGDRLRVYTANKRPLEKLLGVDLIYLNVKLRNMVLIQYKMLEATTDRKDWIYRPDEQLEKEIERMEKFRQAAVAGSEYRLNAEAFYMKFVKRDAPSGSPPVIMPIDHYKQVSMEAAQSGGAIRISYEALGGRYLREAGMVDLIKCGYVGAHAEVSAAFEALIAEILAGGNAVVTAVEEKMS
jgi:hypothetical protein